MHPEHTDPGVISQKATPQDLVNELLRDPMSGNWFLALEIEALNQQHAAKAFIPQPALETLGFGFSCQRQRGSSRKAASTSDERVASMRGRRPRRERQFESGLAAGRGPRSLGSGLLVRMPSTEGVENAACLAYPHGQSRSVERSSIVHAGGTVELNQDLRVLKNGIAVDRSGFDVGERSRAVDTRGLARFAPLDLALRSRIRFARRYASGRG